MFGFGKTREQKFLEAVTKVIVGASNRPIVDYGMAHAFVTDHKSMFVRFFEEQDTPEVAVHMAALNCCDNLMGLASDRDEETCPLSEGITVDIFQWALECYAQNDPNGSGTKLFLDKAEQLEKFFEANGGL